MNGKTVLITGATNGIGKAAAAALAKLGARVVIVGRSGSKTAATAREIKQQTGSAVETITADLSLLAGIRSAAAEFKNRFDRLDVLANNAGAYFAQRSETADGYEMTFALNHLNYFLLTHELLDLLKASAPARVINVSSDAHRGSRMNFDDLMAKTGYKNAGFTAYGQSKLANVLFTYELARRLDGTGVSVNAMHPGFVRSGFGRNNAGLLGALMPVMQLFALTPEQGADTLVYLASAPEVEGVSGKYFVKRQAVASSRESYDEAAQQRLWAISESLVGLAAAV